MAGQVRLGLATALALAATVGSILAQTAATPTPEPTQTPKKEGKGPGGGGWLAGHPGDASPKGPAYENVRKALDALTPEQRKRFQENFWRWANLSPEEKKALRDREDIRKKAIEQETEAALQQAGLTSLEGERREQFIKRYGEGRRAIEEQLRKDMAEKRKPLVHELIGRLSSEFANDPAAASSSQTTIQTVAPATPTAKP